MRQTRLELGVFCRPQLLVFLCEELSSWIWNLKKLLEFSEPYWLSDSLVMNRWESFHITADVKCGDCTKSLEPKSQHFVPTLFFLLLLTCSFFLFFPCVEHCRNEGEPGILEVISCLAGILHHNFCFCWWFFWMLDFHSI